MLNRRRLNAIPLSALAITVFSLAGCKRQANADAAGTGPTDVKVEEVNAYGMVQVDHPEQFLLAAVERRPAVDELQVTGVVAPDVSRSVPVLSLAGGRAVEIRAKLGDVVAKGQVLLVVDSPEVSQAFSDYQKFEADEVFAQQQLARAQDLFAKGAIARQDLESAENSEHKAQVDVRTAKQHIAVLGADINNPTPLVSVRAPISGSIVEQNVTSGTGVRSMDNSPNLFTIADLSRVWVLCDVYENDLHRVQMGEPAEVRLAAFPDRTFAGRVGNISTVLDPATRTAKVRLELANPAGVMRSGMFATSTFRSRTKQLRTVIPTTAIMRLHDKDWVFVPQEGKNFRRQEIQAGPVIAGGFQVVTSGLTEGGKVVANALQFASAAGME
ncbi:MAG: efflux RND transporter periplasmic adaptor subunit [Terriglobia bacterium]